MNAFEKTRRDLLSALGKTKTAANDENVKTNTSFKDDEPLPFPAPDGEKLEETKKKEQLKASFVEIGEDIKNVLKKTETLTNENDDVNERPYFLLQNADEAMKTLEDDELAYKTLMLDSRSDEFFREVAIPYDEKTPMSVKVKESAFLHPVSFIKLLFFDNNDPAREAALFVFMMFMSAGFFMFNFWGLRTQDTEGVAPFIASVIMGLIMGCVSSIALFLVFLLLSLVCVDSWSIPFFKIKLVKGYGTVCWLFNIINDTLTTVTLSCFSPIVAVLFGFFFSGISKRDDPENVARFFLLLVLAGLCYFGMIFLTGVFQKVFRGVLNQAKKSGVDVDVYFFYEPKVKVMSYGPGDQEDFDSKFKRFLTFIVARRLFYRMIKHMSLTWSALRKES